MRLLNRIHRPAIRLQPGVGAACLAIEDHASGRTVASRTGIKAGLALAILWGFHAAASSYPGRAYFNITRLNDSSQPVAAGVLLLPAFVCALIFVLVRSKTPLRTATRDGHVGLAAALACWFAGGTIATIANWNADQVLLTYCSVFLAGAAIYWAVARVEFTIADVEVGIAGLAAGTLFPLIDGLRVFVQEWGIPDTVTAQAAYLDVARMQNYEQVTFGNRGNTTGFILIVGPLLLAVALDPSRRKRIRLISACTLVPVLGNMFILQSRAGFIALALSLAVVWGFRLGVRRYPLFIATLVVVLAGSAAFLPEVSLAMTDRLRPVLSADFDDDRSLRERSEAIREGIAVAERNWQVGIGPGGSLTGHSWTSAHQFQVQQFMEAGVLGLVGSAMFSLSVLGMLVFTVIRGKDGGANNLRFSLLIGPATYVSYSLAANAALNNGYINTWTVIVISMLAATTCLSPPVGVSRRRWPLGASAHPRSKALWRVGEDPAQPAVRRG